MSNTLARCGAILALMIQAGCQAQPLPEPECRLQDPQLDELSGLAASDDGHFWWGLNDSGGAARLYRIGACGENLGGVDIDDARNFDWEDLAAFSDDGRPSLLIGDIGDNTAHRRRVRLLALAEPADDATRASLSWQQHFSYPGGARDAEALAVDPHNGDILVLSKRESPPHLYRVPRGDGVVVAEDLGAIETIRASLARNWLRGMIYQLYGSMPTSMDISRDGRRIAVLTLTEAFVWTRESAEPWVALMNREPQHFEIPWALEQAESLAFSADGQTLLVSSEKSGAPMLRIPLK